MHRCGTRLMTQLHAGDRGTEGSRGSKRSSVMRRAAARGVIAHVRGSGKTVARVVIRSSQDRNWSRRWKIGAAAIAVRFARNIPSRHHLVLRDIPRLAGAPSPPPPRFAARI